MQFEQHQADAVLAWLGEQLGDEGLREAMTQAIYAEHEPGFANVRGSRLADVLQDQFRDAADAAIVVIREWFGVTE